MVKGQKCVHRFVGVSLAIWGGWVRDLLSDGGGGAGGGVNFKTHPPKIWENPRTQKCPTPKDPPTQAAPRQESGCCGGAASSVGHKEKKTLPMFI